jgi:hypothetical protein
MRVVLRPRLAEMEGKKGGRGRLTSGGGRLAGIDVADNDDVDMNLLFTVVRLLVDDAL